MAEVVRMPKMSDTMTEGTLAKWHKKVGDKVKSGDVLAEVETDKATMDFESFQEGTLLYVGVEEGAAVPVDNVIAVLGEEGEDYKSLLEGDADSKDEKKDSEKGSGKKSDDKKDPENPDDAANAEGNEEEEEDDDADDSDGGSVEEKAQKVGANVIRMPLLSDTMTEGTIVKWNKKVGDTVKSDDNLADVETDKATMEINPYVDGVLLHVGVEEGSAAKVNDIIAIIGKEGTDVEALLKGGDKPAKKKSDAGSKKQATADKKQDATPEKSEKSESAEKSDSRVKASPLAKKIARDKGIDISEVKGSAENGRITKKDVEGFTPSTKEVEQAAKADSAQKEIKLPSFTGEEKYTEKPITNMRKTIAKRLSESMFTSPHFYVTMQIDMDAAIAARAKMNEFSPVKISFNDLVLKAAAVALRQHPAINSSWLNDKIRFNEHIHIGVAVAVDEGLLVPVVRFADGKSLSHISQEVKDFAGKAKAKKLQPSDWEGSTFSISNLGMFGVDEFTAIINPPNSCILAIGGISQVPVVKNGAVVPGNIMKVTLSSDHRTVDGASAAAFLQTFKQLLEEPVRLLV
ncbi:MAG: pyruvate dehydrogenase complex dihydrolipoamide acetyltransferase [Mucilaginibacter polytrichastri]|nr:pyruvate dehydrogenase complex dihydrolipoamide acetyltransferase [Mucilaginibacter polytrichastri]